MHSLATFLRVNWADCHGALLSHPKPSHVCGGAVHFSSSLSSSSFSFFLPHCLFVVLVICAESVRIREHCRWHCLFPDFLFLFACDTDTDTKWVCGGTRQWEITALYLTSSVSRERENRKRKHQGRRREKREKRLATSVDVCVCVLMMVMVIGATLTLTHHHWVIMHSVTRRRRAPEENGCPFQ